MSFQTESYANTAKTIITNLEKRNMKGYYCKMPGKPENSSVSLFPTALP